MSEGQGRFTYFVKMGKFIKIGSSTKPQRRIAQLQTGFPNQLKVLAVVPYDVISEDEAHRKFYLSRSRGEWFYAQDDLLAFIEAAKVHPFNKPPRQDEPPEPLELGACLSSPDHYRKMTALRGEFMKLRKHSDKGIRSRSDILIQNVEYMRRDENDQLVARQFRINLADLERYKAGRV